jgi:hypothetical protein
MPNNVFFSQTGRYEYEKLDGYNRAGKSPLGPRDGTVLADPKLLRPTPTVFDFVPDSPCIKLGIKPVDVSKAGRQTPDSEEAAR